ncbi:MAG TPA: hypothetical protein VHW05_16060 [Phenylobacterium sp.]|jgi:hypothetical protein|nr:hypothetical protein [Phenylobacterium sp.]
MLMRGISRSVLHACQPNELWCLNNLGREALAAGDPHAATSYFEQLVIRASETNFADQFPEHFALFNANLDEARASAALLEAGSI